VTADCQSAIQQTKLSALRLCGGSWVQCAILLGGISPHFAPPTPQNAEREKVPVYGRHPSVMRDHDHLRLAHVCCVQDFAVCAGEGQRVHLRESLPSSAALWKSAFTSVQFKCLQGNAVARDGMFHRG
jgi:hypothetical protein